mgnify:CR=1 FL=1
MRKIKFIPLLISSLTLLITGCDFNLPTLPGVDSDEKYSYTIMLYMSGSTLEYDSSATGAYKTPGLMSGDIKEILSIKNIPGEFKIIIENANNMNYNNNEKMR